MIYMHICYAKGGMQIGFRGMGIACVNNGPNKISDFTLIENTHPDNPDKIL